VRTSYFDLSFANNKTLFKSGREVVTAQQPPDWIVGPASQNIVFSDITHQSFTSQKDVFGTGYLVVDSLKKIDWKITNETRTIAGLECRKATAVIMDSLFIVAFYTDQILVAGGPEGFTGLPGMILGLAVPRLHTTWFATRLTLSDVKETDLVPPKKGKKLSCQELKLLLQKATKDWGRSGSRDTWQIMI